jgi:excisionase family DNA binding protein
MKYLTVKEAAERLGCSAATIYELCAARRLPHTRVGLRRGVIRISEADLAAYLANRHIEQQQPPLRFIR